MSEPEEKVSEPEGHSALTITYPTVIGKRPSHTHKCGHECNSPYCEEVKEVDCANCGGPAAIQQGREPWRGR